jgi:signal transduction histidine kinase
VLAQFAERVQARSGLTVTSALDGQVTLPLPVEREIWHVAREAATNAERHAAATAIAISWHCSTARGAVLTITDDGTGFDADQVRAGGYGLVGMRERAEGIGARLDIVSELGQGTIVKLSMVATAPGGSTCPSR